MNPQPEAVLADNSELGDDGIACLNLRLERYYKAHHRALLMADYASDRGESKLSYKLRKCGDWLVFRHYYTVDKLRLHSADFCKKHLLCPLCAIRRGAKFLKAYLEKLDLVLAAQSGLKAYMVTLTVVDGEDLTERFNHLRRGIKSMMQARRDFLSSPANRRRVEFCKALGGVYSIEAKRGKNSGLWHPHAHMIWLCEDEPDQLQLSDEWREWTGDSFIVDVRPFYDQEDFVSGFVEVFKYALKFSELPLDDNWMAYESLSNKRLVDAFGILRGVIVPDSLSDDPLDDLPFIELFYKYLNRGGYTLKKSVLSTGR